MKIGILTFPNSQSYGAIMQMYALYRAIEKMGADAEIINYYNSYMKQGKHCLGSDKAPEIRRLLKNMAGRILHWRQYSGFRAFEQELHKYPTKATYDINDIVGLEARYDAVVCGSDQVWNAKITNGDLSFYLDFCKGKTKRISYAPSFGRVAYSQQIEEEIKRELLKFDFLSVREEEGKHYIQQLTGQIPEVVLDPTFLLCKDEYIELEKAYPIPEEGYILCYTIRLTQKLLEFCREIAEKENKKLIIVGGNIIKNMANKDERVCYANDLAPGEWLYLVHHAHCVVTNSFHGTAFSIHYHKDFYVEFSSDTNSRLEQIIKMTGLEERVIGNADGYINESINYDTVDLRVSEWRDRSLRFLEKAIQ